MKPILPIAVTLVLGLAGASCGSDAVFVAGDPAGELAPDDLVFETLTGGGLIPTVIELRQFPSLIVLGDGRAIRRSASDAGTEGPTRAYRPLEQAVLETDEVQEILDLVASSGLFDGPVDFGEPLITDVSSTGVGTRLGGKVVRVGAYALGFEEDSGLSSDQLGARDDLRELLSGVADIVNRDGRTWQPATPPEMLVFTLSFDRPADDTSEPIPWPLDPALVDVGDEFIRCVAVSGSDAATLADVAATATEYTPWIVDGGERHLAFRPNYPHQAGCPS